MSEIRMTGEHDEGFYVVSGTVRFTSGERWFDAPARTLVMVPPGAPHSFANPAGEPAVMLNAFTPDLYIGYFRGSQAEKPHTHCGGAEPARPSPRRGSWP